MKYFIDTEFIEGFHKPLFGKRRHFIDLISIGIVAEDGRKYHAISREYNYKKANAWVKQNVIAPLYTQTVHGDIRNVYSEKNFHLHFGKENVQIAQDIIEFINPDIDNLIRTYTRHNSWMDKFYPNEFDYIRKHNTKIPDHYYSSGNDGYVKNRALIYNQPEFYGYYSDYDWVLFCSLFGTMMQLPRGFPMYCTDLKQMMDERGLTKEWKQKNHPDPEGEHNALVDAKWNMELYKKIIKKPLSETRTF